MTTMRNAEEVFAHHGQALGAEDLEDIVSDYSDDAILISQNEVYRGKDGARAGFTQLLQDVPKAVWTLGTVFADDVLYLEWKARSRGRHVEDGIDTLSSGTDGQIRPRNGKQAAYEVRFSPTRELAIQVSEHRRSG